VRVSNWHLNINGRCDIEKKAGTYGQLNVGLLGAQAPAVYDSNPVKYSYSKGVMAKARQLFRNGHGSNLISQVHSTYVSDPTLSSFVARAFPPLALLPPI
jgi:hypothetical protein